MTQVVKKKVREPQDEQERRDQQEEKEEAFLDPKEEVEMTEMKNLANVSPPLHED